MATDQEAPDNVEDATEDEAPKKGGGLKSLVLVVVGLGLGTGGGLFFVGPRFFGGPSQASAESVDGGHGADPGASDDGHGASSGEDGEGVGTMHTIANLIVNPAGSNGSRFLLVDLAVGLTSEEAVLELESLDAAVRDELLLLLGSKTVQELADVNNRAALKAEIRKIVSALLRSGSAHEIFFPRFVIQ